LGLLLTGNHVEFFSQRRSHECLKAWAEQRRA
jgi:hypothetical protein